MVSINKPLSNEFTKNKLIALAKSNLNELAFDSLSQLYSSIKPSSDLPYGSLYSLDWIIIDGLKTFRNLITLDLTKNPVAIIFGPNGSGKTSIALSIHYSICGMQALRRQKRSGSSYFSNRALGDRWISIKSQFSRSWGPIKSIQIARMIRKRKAARIDSLVPLASDESNSAVLTQPDTWDPHNVVRTPENVNSYISKSLGLQYIELLDLSQMQFFHEKHNYILSRNYRKVRRNLILWASGLRALSWIHSEIKKQIESKKAAIERTRQRCDEVRHLLGQAGKTQEETELRNESNLRAVLKNLDDSTRKDVVRALEQHFERLSIEEKELVRQLDETEQIKSFITNEMEQRSQHFIDMINQHFEAVQVRIFDSKQPMLQLGDLGKLNITKRTKYDDFSKAEQKLLEILFRLSFISVSHLDKGYLLLETPSEDLDQEYKQLLVQELARFSREGHRLVCTETNPRFAQALKHQCSAAVLDLSEHAALSTTKLEQTSLDYFYEEV
ncbi:MAG: AAA family ATPase [Candidatus Hodarchaeota archaeon]